MTTLETRRVRADLLETFKILKGFEFIDINNFFELHVGIARGHKLKLYKMRVNKDIGKFSFRNRVVNEWNNLPDNVIDSDSVNIFKNRLDHYLRTVGGFI